MKDERRKTIDSRRLQMCGVPAVIGIHGVEEVLEYQLTTDEMKRFKECVDTIHRNIERGNQFLPR